MALLYIDTNIFLDFYQASTDRLEVFSEIEARADLIVLPRQTIDEFHRNRIARLESLAAQIEKNSITQIYTTAVVQAFPEFEEWKKHREGLGKSVKAIVSHLKNWVNNPSSDQVLMAFERIVEKACVLEMSDEAFNRANRRKLLGNPPTSPDKHSIGDEVIWEVLMEHVSGDLIMVTRDKNLLKNQSLMKEEFLVAGKRQLVAVVGRLNQAFERLSVPSEKIEKIEIALEDSRQRAAEQILVVPDVCPHCRLTLVECGFEGSDGDEAWWLECPKCDFIFWGR